MKRYRSALMAGLLALAVAVCDDDGTVVQPPPVVNVSPPDVTVTVPPAPPTVAPLTAMITPPSAEVGVGGMVDFAVGTSGGSGAASWTCTSSDTAVATVETTDTGCRAAAVAGGGVTVTAAVTKGSESTNVAAQLTVSTTADAFILVTNISSGGEGDDDVKGRVSVDVSVERGNQTFERLSLNLDGMEVAAQDFGTAAADDAEQAVHTFTLSFDSDGYDSETGAVDYMNGEHSIQALLKIAGRDELIMSNILPVEFANEDGYVVTTDLGDNYAMGDDGNRWYGGPSNGMIEIMALPVLYSGGSVSSVAVTFCGMNKTADAMPFMVSIDCGDEFEGETMVAIDDGDGNILKGGGMAYIDNVGPANAPIIIANRNGREMGWINGYVGITGEYDADDAKDNWLVEGEGGAGDMGVGGYNMGVMIGKDLEAALGDDAMSSLPAESDDNEAYCAVAVAMDDLGNMAGLPDADEDTCRAAPDGADALVNHDVAGIDAGTPDTDGMLTPNVWGYDDTPDDATDNVTDLAGQTLEFGVDMTAPVIEFGDEYDMRFATDLSGSPFAFERSDDESDVGNSGIDSDAGLRVGLQRRTASKTECITIADDGAVAADAEVDDDCGTTAISDEDVTLAADVANAYYTLSGMARDRAGNRSETISHVFVFDGMAASATAPSVPGVVAAGKPFQGAVYLNDDLSIRDYYGTMDYGTGTPIRLGIGLPLAVDAFNAASFTHLNHPVTAAVGIITATGGLTDPYKALQTSLGGALTPLSTVTIFVRDQAQAGYGTGMPSASLTRTGDAGEDDDFDTGAFGIAFQGLGDDGDYEVCGYAKCDDEDLDATLKIEVRAVAPAPGSFGDPFERVDFWVTDINGASWRIGVDESGTSGRLGGDGTSDADNPRNRTWSYSITVPGTMLRMATRPGTDDDPTNDATDTDVMIRAIGLNDEGVGLVTSLELAGEDFGVEETD